MDKPSTKFELRPYQSDALNEVRAAFGKGFKRVVLQLPCGGGKTQIAATMIRGAVDKGRKCLFVCDRIELIDQTSKRFDAEGIPHGVIQGQHERCRPYEPVQICSIQTLGARKRWPDAEFIIQDECFPAGTMVSTVSGDVPIEFVHSGVAVYNATGVGEVLSVFARTVPASRMVKVRFEDGTEARCTEEHPFFTGNAWIQARRLAGESVATIEAMPGLWDCDTPQNVQSKKRFSSFRVGKGLVGKNDLLAVLCEEVEEPDVFRGSEAEGFSNPSRIRSSAKVYWGKWKADSSPTIGYAQGARRWVDYGICGEDREENGGQIPDTLQAGLSESGGNAVYRGGRVKSFNAGEKTPRHQENQLFGFKRVESVEVEQQGSDEIVYNLRVSGHPSYFANGFLVHNCHSRYATMDKIIARWGNVPMVGLSATPWSKGLGKSWEHLVVGTTTGELIDLGFLVPFRVYGPQGPDLSKVKTVAGEYHEGQLAEAVDQPKLVADIVSTWLKLGEDRQTICFATNILHSRHIVAQFKAAGVKAEHIDAYSDTEERRSILKRFEDGDTRIVSSVDILTKGYDQPLASCMIDARPTKSLILHAQKCGRVLRISPGKDLAKILDHSGNTARLGFVTDELPSELDDGKKKETKPLERKEPLPKPCPSCNYMKPAKVYACPSCGFKPEKLNSIESAPGELVEISRAKKENRSMSSEEKAHFYGQLKWIAQNRGYNKHWADHTYRAKLSVWPNAYKDAPMHVATPSTIAYVQSQLIRHSKRRA
jgi:superfamily II DNA or RNA helicase